MKGVIIDIRHLAVILSAILDFQFRPVLKKKAPVKFLKRKVPGTQTKFQNICRMSCRPIPIAIGTRTSFTMPRTHQLGKVINCSTSVLRYQTVALNFPQYEM